MNTTSIIEETPEDFVEVVFNIYQWVGARSGIVAVSYETAICARLGKANGIPERDKWIIKYVFDNQEIIRLKD